MVTLIYIFLTYRHGIFILVKVLLLLDPSFYPSLRIYSYNGFILCYTKNIDCIQLAEVSIIHMPLCRCLMWLWRHWSRICENQRHLPSVTDYMLMFSHIYINTICHRHQYSEGEDTVCPQFINNALQIKLPAFSLNMSFRESPAVL